MADDSLDYNDDRPCRIGTGGRVRSTKFSENQFSERQEEAQPPLLDSRTAPGAAELVVMGHWAAAEEQLLAQSLSLTAPGAVVVVLMGHSAAAEEQLLAQSLSPTAPGAASLLLQQSPEVLQQQAQKGGSCKGRQGTCHDMKLLRMLDLAPYRGFSTVCIRSQAGGPL